MRILCLGDSLTDCDRLFSDSVLGNGYVFMLQNSSEASAYNWNFVNRGIDGFTISKLLSNVRSQYLPLKPDLVTILIGINDIGIMQNTNRTEAQKQQLLTQFFYNYESLIRQLRQTVNQIILLEPFIFPVPEEFLTWIPYVNEMSEGIRSLARRYQLPFLPLQKYFLQVSEKAGLVSITTDGIHLSHYGQSLLAEQLKQVLQSFSHEKED